MAAALVAGVGAIYTTSTSENRWGLEPRALPRGHPCQQQRREVRKLRLREEGVSRQ